MKKRLLCLFLGIVMLLSVALTACSTSEEEEADVDEDMGAQTITMRLISEKKVCNNETELAAYLDELKAQGKDENSQEYKDMLKTMDAYQAVEDAFSKITKSKYKINVDLMFYTEDEYYGSLENSMNKFAIEGQQLARAQRALAKYIADYQEWWTATYPGADFPTTLVTNDFYERFPEFAEYRNKMSGSADEDDEDGVYFEEQYKENEDGIQELVYPEADDNQLDIIYLSGLNRYNEYIEKEWIMDLTELIGTTGKKLNDYITGALMNGVKVDGMTYAIPNNVQIGEYTYMLIDKDLYVSYYGTDYTQIDNVLDLGVFLNDIKANEPDVIPIGADFDECIGQFVWYWNLDRETFLDAEGNPLEIQVPKRGSDGEILKDKEGNTIMNTITATKGYKVNTQNKFSLIGALYGDPATAGRGQIQLGFNALFNDENYRNIFYTLKEYELNGYYKTADDQRTKAAVSFVKGDYTIKGEALENDGIYTDADGKEYYAYVIKHPEVDEESLYGNMFAVSSNSKRSRACMQILTLINTNSEARNILQYGVEGVNYNINKEDGVLTRLNDSYMMSIEKTGNCFIAYPDPRNGAGLTMNYWENSKKQNNDALINPLLGFDINKELGLTELATFPVEEIEFVYEGYTDIDHVLLGKITTASNNIMAAIDELTTIEEIKAYVEASITSSTALGSIEKKQYSTLPGIEGMVQVFKITDHAYETDYTVDDTRVYDANGESPYKVYYEWMSGNQYLPK